MEKRTTRRTAQMKNENQIENKRPTKKETEVKKKKDDELVKENVDKVVKKKADKVVKEKSKKSDEEKGSRKRNKRDNNEEKPAVKSKRRKNVENNENNQIEEVKKTKRQPASKKSKNQDNIENAQEKLSDKQSENFDDVEEELDEKKTKLKKNKTETNFNSIDFTIEKEYNVKISSWNVGGIRALMQKGGLEYLEKENPDILCVQELKSNFDKLPEEFKNYIGYHKYYHLSEKDGYSGVALFSKKMPLNVLNGFNDPEHDCEGRLITAEFEKYYVLSVYVPNAGRKLVTMSKKLDWNTKFLKFVNDLNEKKPVIICGDMNVAHTEIDLKNPKTNKKTAGFTQEERDGMTEFLSNGYVDSYRHLYPTTTGVYTFWSYMQNARAKNVGWRLDYFILSQRLIKNLVEHKVRPQVYGSDHCPIVLFLNF